MNWVRDKSGWSDLRISLRICRTLKADEQESITDSVKQLIADIREGSGVPDS